MTFPVYAIDCQTDPGAVAPGDVASGNIPNDCTPAGGVQFTVTENGQPLAAGGTVAAGGRFAFVAAQAAGVYTTDATGKFEVTAQIGSTLVITENASTDPLGFAPRENPITLVVTVNEDGTVFVNLPQVGPSPSASPGPSASPSAAPSASPSAAPSASPSTQPSASPSIAPSASPSAAPSPKASTAPVPAQLPNTGAGGSDDPGFGFRLGQWLVALLTLAGFGSAGYGLRRRREMRQTFRRPPRV